MDDASICVTVYSQWLPTGLRKCFQLCLPKLSKNWTRSLSNRAFPKKTYFCWLTLQVPLPSFPNFFLDEAQLFKELKLLPGEALQAKTFLKKSKPKPTFEVQKARRGVTLKTDTDLKEALKEIRGPKKPSVQAAAPETAVALVISPRDMKNMRYFVSIKTFLVGWAI